MQHTINSSAKNPETCRYLLICFISIMFFGVNIVDLFNSGVITAARLKLQTVEEIIEYEEKKAFEEIAVSEEITAAAGYDETYAPDQIPVIDSAILAGTSKVVVIDGANQKGFSTLEDAMESIGRNSGSYLIVFIQDYTFKNYDIIAVEENGMNCQLTVMSTYKDDSGSTYVKSIRVGTFSWICGGATTFKNINISSLLNIYANCHKLTIDSGVICGTIFANIYGSGVDDQIGNSDITILSGHWNSIYAGNIKSTMNGSAVITIGQTAEIEYLRSVAVGVTGNVTVTVDGSEGAKVHQIDAQTAAAEYCINLNNVEISKNLFMGNANVEISGVCSVGSAVTTDLRTETTITLNEGAVLSNGSGKHFICPKASLIFGADSKLSCNGANNMINNIIIAGAGAQLAVTKGNPMTVSGSSSGEHKLNIDFVSSTLPVLLDEFLIFTTETNAREDHFAYPGTNEYDGILSVNGRIVYFDFMPEGYIHNWYNEESLFVGGHNAERYVNDLKCQFNLETAMNQDLFRLWSGQLQAKINDYADGLAFNNYFQGIKPDFKYTIKVGTTIYYLTGSKTGTHKVTADPVFRGYKKSPDGSNLDLAFYLGADVGIVYLHLGINPKSTVMTESWEYINLSGDTQEIIMSHGGDITYAGVDDSYCISGPGKNTAYAFQDPSDPVMFMWVDQITTPNPAVAGKFAPISEAVGGGLLFADSLAETIVSGTLIDTGIAIQWQYSVAAGATQSASGGTAFGNRGSIQTSGNDIVLLNPGQQHSEKTVAHSAINVSNADISFTADAWSINGLPEGMTVTGIPALLQLPAAATSDFKLSYFVGLEVRPGTYPVHYSITNGSETYSFTDNITVIRDEIKLTAAVNNEDSTANVTAIAGLTAAAAAPVTGPTIYKHYSGKLSWGLDSSQYGIKQITVNKTPLTQSELAAAKADNYLTFADLKEHIDVVIYVGEPEAATNRVTVSKTAQGAPAGQAFAFSLTVKDKDGNALPDKTKLYCRGGIIVDSGATAPALTELVLDPAGQATFNLGDGQLLEIMNVPAQGKIQVVESLATEYDTACTINDIAVKTVNQKDSGLLDIDHTDKVIAFHNIHTDSLTISKTVKGKSADQTKAFAFDILVQDQDGNNITKNFDYQGSVLSGDPYTGVTTPPNGILSITDGTGRFQLSHGQSIIIKQLDPTYTIRITEIHPGVLYSTKHQKNGVVTAGRTVAAFKSGGADVSIDFTNTKMFIPGTGITADSRAGITLLGIVLGGCAIAGFARKRRRKE